ncbi:response regulator [Candidatus Albibeggiatoa sp. nov. BB20]|uniref:response regulator n=1 Tax=Candidatus Albibeggiatoa sp. nov. BB20 TaxID=3162723 RepID=UPI0033656321
MDTQESPPQLPKTTVKLDTIILISSNLIFYLLAINFDIWDRLHDFSRTYEHWELDEIFVLILPNTFFLGLYSLRRWLELKEQLIYQTWLTKQYHIARQQADAANQAKSEFLANMSHEIRTPINGLIGATDLLLDTKLDAEQDDYAHTVKQSSDALLTLINDILDFSKIEARQLILEESAFVLRDCVEHAIDLIALRAHQKQLNVAYFIEPNVPEILIGDVTRLRQIMINLLSNALKFTDEGEINIHVTLKAIKDENQGVVQFDIQDSGMGIAPDKIQNLFNEFVQADTSITRKYGGTGLGLAISKNLCELMNGQIWIESELGQGTTFSFTIQVEMGQESVYPQLYQSTPCLTGKKVLLCTRKMTLNHKILNSFMQQWGMSVHSFHQPDELMKYLELDNTVDIAVLDTFFDAKQFASIIKQFKSCIDYTQCELLALTQLDHSKTFLQQDGVYFLTKPLKPKKLHNHLVNLFSESETTERTELIEKIQIQVLNTNVLLAEDNKVNQKVARIILEKIGCKVTVANNGLEVLELLAQQQNYDIILMDVQMPEMDGLTATRNIIDQYTDNRPVIIAMTANAMQGDKEQCLQAGMDDYLVKPINRQLLAEKLAYYSNC